MPIKRLILKTVAALAGFTMVIWIAAPASAGNTNQAALDAAGCLVMATSLSLPMETQGRHKWDLLSVVEDAVEAAYHVGKAEGFILGVAEALDISPVSLSKNVYYRTCLEKL